MNRGRIAISRSCQFCFRQAGLLKPSLQPVVFGVDRSAKMLHTTSSLGATSVPFTAKGPNLPLGDLNTSSNVAEVVSQSADAFGVSAFHWLKPSGLVQDALIYLTETSGLSWPLALSLAAVSMRIMIVPAIVWVKRVAAKRHNLAPERAEVMKKETEAVIDMVKSGKRVPVVASLLVQRKVMEFEKKKGTDPMKLLLPSYMQLPVFVIMFTAIRDLAERKFVGLTTSGFLWIPDLSSADPFFLLPAINLSLIFLALRIGVDNPVNSFFASRKFTVGFFAALPVAAYLTNIYFPSALVVYWLASNCVGIALNKVLALDVVRVAFKIPKSVKHPGGFDEFQMSRDLNERLSSLLKQRLMDEQREAFKKDQDDIRSRRQSRTEK